MKINILQSLLKRNSNQIARLEEDLRDYSQGLKYGFYDNMLPDLYSQINRNKKAIKKLAEIQRELKENMDFAVRNGRLLRRLRMFD